MTTIGFSAYTRLAHDRIAEYFSAPQREALVIGVFGEWGSGKSTLLADIAAAYPNTPPQDESSTVTLRVDFNAWRYEREEHLLIPLLFTVETTLKEYLDRLEEPRGDTDTSRSWWPWSRQERESRRPPTTAARAWLRARAERLGRCVAALTHAVKFTVGIKEMVEAEIDPAAVINAYEAQRERAEERAREAAGLRPRADWRSLYYDLHRELMKVTRGRGADDPKLNFIFFIDDLDRCLPEKAVEMLEAIKLFLDIEGCVFVLAVDDEVVERGIAHRYRDYLGIGDGSADSVAYSLKPERFREFRTQFAAGGLSGSAPITGHEYLEKIIQLPIRLPRFSRDQARQLLLDTAARLKSPELFVASTPYPGREPNEWLLDLFLVAAPMSPRKLIRAVELLDFVNRLAKHQQRFETLHPYTLAQLVLLQCFAPQMFRDLARRRAAAWKRLAERIEEADVARVAVGSPSFLSWWEDRIRDDRGSDDPGVVKRAEVIEQPFVAQLRQTIGFRSGFDPRDLFLAGFDVDDDLTPYFNLVTERPPVADSAAPTSVSIPSDPFPVSTSAPDTAAPAVVAAPEPDSRIADPMVVPAPAPLSEARPAPPVPPPPRPAPAASLPPPQARTAVVSRPPNAPPLTATPRQPRTFVDLLMAPDAATRIGAVRDEPALAGRVLDSRTVGFILERVKATPTVVTAAWLTTIGPHLSDDDLKQMLRTPGVSDRLASEQGAAAIDDLGRLLEWFCLRMRPAHVADSSPLRLDEIGLTEEIDAYRPEWAYRYLRGIRHEGVTPEETLEAWPAYAATVESDVRCIVEMDAGRIAMATADGEIGLWSRSLRGAWQMDVKVASCGPASIEVAPMGPFGMATLISEQGLTVWQGHPNGWQWKYRSGLLNATRLTALGPNAVAMCVSNLTLRVGLDTGDARGGSQWQFWDMTFPQPVQSLVPVSTRLVLTVTGHATVIEVTSAGLQTRTIAKPATEGESFLAAARAANVFLLITAGGRVETWTYDDGALTYRDALASSLTSVVAVRASGPFALLIGRDGSGELWNCEGAQGPQRLAAGPLGAAPHPGVCLLRDGSVLVSTPTNVQRFAANHSTAKLEFAETVVPVDPNPVFIAAAATSSVTLARGSTLFAIADGEPAICEAVPTGLNTMVAGTSVGSDGVAVIGRSKSVAIVTWGSPAVVRLEEEPRFVASCGDAVVVGLRGQLVFVARRGGTWEIERPHDQLVDIRGFAADAANNHGVAWSETGTIYLVRRSASYQPTENRFVQAPVGADRLRSVVPIGPEQLGGTRDAQSRFLVCSDRTLVVVEVGPFGVRLGAQTPVNLKPEDAARFAMPLGLDQIVVLTRSAVVISMTSGSPSREWTEWPSLLHGSPKEAVMVGAGDAVVVRTADDAVYRLSFESGNVVRARRYLVHPPVLVDDEVRDDGSVGVARLCSVKSGGVWPPLVKSTADLLNLDPAIANLAAWVRGNGRLATVFDRTEQVAVLPMPGEGPTYLQLVATPRALD